MSSIYIILDKLNTEIENSYIITNEEEYNNIDYSKDEYFSLYIPNNTNENNKYFIIIPDGTVYEINDFNKIRSNINQLREYGKNIVSNDVKKYEEESELLLKSDPKKDILSCIRGSVIRSTIFSILEKSLEDNKEEIKKDSINAIIKERENNYEIRTELDYLNNMIENCIEDKEGLKIEKCYYNGKEIDSEDMIYELQSHYFPNYITQKNIEDTLCDYYCIKTNKGIILRKKDTGEIIILSPNSNIPEEYIK